MSEREASEEEVQALIEDTIRRVTENVQAVVTSAVDKALKALKSDLDPLIEETVNDSVNDIDPDEVMRAYWREKQRISRAKARHNASVNDNVNDTALTLTLSSSQSKSQSKRQTAVNDVNDNYPEDFLAFWEKYPKKAAKPVAYRSWVVNAKYATQIMAALEWQVKSDDWKRDKFKYVPYPATYLNQRRWEDEPPYKPQAPVRPSREEVLRKRAEQDAAEEKRAAEFRAGLEAVKAGLQ